MISGGGVGLTNLISLDYEACLCSSFVMPFHGSNAIIEELISLLYFLNSNNGDELFQLQKLIFQARLF